jgi:hypothetical protein
MHYTRFTVLLVAVLCGPGTVLPAMGDSVSTNAPPKVSIEELLNKKERWQSNRVEVIGFYNSFFEHSVLTPKQGDPPAKGLWVDSFCLAPGSKDKIKWVEKGLVRIIGKFYFRDGYRTGHLGACLAGITEIEVFQAAGNSNTNTPTIGAPKPEKPTNNAPEKGANPNGANLNFSAAQGFC